MKRILNRCPICGNRLEYSALMQYSDVYAIKNNGELTKNRVRKEDVGAMECGFITCTSTSCDFATDCDLKCIAYPDIKIWSKDGKYYYKDEMENMNETKKIRGKPK